MSETFDARPAPRLSLEAFELLRRVIRARAGISLNDSKRALVEARLARRLRATGCASFDEYAHWVEGLDAEDAEVLELLNCMTTNKTSFFREPHHFEALERSVIPELRARAERSGDRRLRVWSAGCSTGQEAYSIAITLRRALAGATGWDVKVLASDLDTRVLDVAREGVYAASELHTVPVADRARFFAPVSRGLYRVSEEVRELVTFRRINLADAAWPIRTTFDAIFCRNVVIYFERDTQRAVYERIAALLEPEGYLFAGHSENLYWMSDLFRSAGPTAYKPAHAPRATGRGESPKAPALRQVSLQAGGVHVTAEPACVRTVLGSCVAVCLHDPVARVGGMNHFVLPDGVDDVTPARFGNHAMEALLEGLARLGAREGRLEAKIFGGANLVTSLAGERSVADRNVAFVERWLEERGIAVVAKKIGGERALVVAYDPTTGRARVRVVDADRRAISVTPAPLRESGAPPAHASHVR